MVYLIRRFGSAYFDALLIAIFNVILYVSYSLLLGNSISQIEGPSANYWLKLEIVSMILYYSIFEFLFKRTIGKMLFQMKVEGISENKGLIRMIQILKRTLARFIPFEPFSIFFSEDRIMWHDNFSRTRVVDFRNKSKS